MAQEFTIKSETIETKINQLLPSQGGFGAGVDFSASTMVIPIIDLTETAEGSGLRADLQTSLSHSTVTAFNVNNTTTTLINTTGYFRVNGTVVMASLDAGTAQRIRINISDGFTSKSLYDIQPKNLSTAQNSIFYALDFNILIKAGGSLSCIATSNAQFSGSTRQIADLDGNLVNP